MSIRNTTMIAITETKLAVERSEAATVEEMLAEAMKATRHHWMVTDEQEQFRAAVGAVMLLASDDDKERLAVEMRSLNALSAMLSGLPIDFERVEPVENPIGLVKMWHASETA